MVQAFKGLYIIHGSELKYPQELQIERLGLGFMALGLSLDLGFGALALSA